MAGNPAVSELTVAVKNDFILEASTLQIVLGDLMGWNLTL